MNIKKGLSKKEQEDMKKKVCCFNTVLLVISTIVYWLKFITIELYHSKQQSVIFESNGGGPMPPILA